MLGRNISFEAFVADYIECALWVSAGDDDEPLNCDHDQSDLSPEALKRIYVDCRDFYAVNFVIFAPQGENSAGHDFWLTRNGHGAGFWDGDWPEPAASILDDASKTAGGCSLYKGDDGKLYTTT